MPDDELFEMVLLLLDVYVVLNTDVIIMQRCFFRHICSTVGIYCFCTSYGCENAQVFS